MTVRQAVCPKCGSTIRPGRGQTVAGVRFHQECLAPLNGGAVAADSASDDGQGHLLPGIAPKVA